MDTMIIIFVSLVGGGLLSILGSLLFKAVSSKEEEKSICLDFFYTREKENDTVQEVRFYYKDTNSIYNSNNPDLYFTYRSGFNNKEALRHHIDQACENRGWKFEFTDYEVDYATGLPIEKVEKETK